MTENNTWPGWECVRQLGAGSFGKVYEIRRKETNKEYKAALKVITIPYDQSEIQSAISEGMDEQSVTEYFRGMVENITDEVALMSELVGNSNIVSYEDHMIKEHVNGIGWDILIRMELLNPLQEWSASYPLSVSDVITLGCDICRALEKCQMKNIIHRDIKPENIFVNEYGDYKLGDFGIARTVEKTVSNLSQKGTYTYIAPEVYKGQDYGRTADIYSLGVVLYRYLNKNRVPFLPTEGNIRYEDRENALKRRMRGEQIPPPRDGSEKLKGVVLVAMAYEPGDRFQSAQAFRTALENCRVNSFSQWDVEEPTVGIWETENEKEDTETVILGPSQEEQPYETDYKKAVVQNDTAYEGKKRNRKKWAIIGVIVAIVLALMVMVGIGIGISNTPENRLQWLLDSGNKYQAEQEYEKAAMAFEEAITINDRCMEAYMGGLEAYLGMGDAENAKEFYDRTLTMLSGLDATYADENRESIVTLYLAADKVYPNDSEKVAEMLEEGYGRTGEDKRVGDELIKTYIGIAQKKTDECAFEDALKIYDRLIALDHENAEMIDDLCVCLRNINNLLLHAERYDDIRALAEKYRDVAKNLDYTGFLDEIAEIEMAESEISAFMQKIYDLMAAQDYEAMYEEVDRSEEVNAIMRRMEEIGYYKYIFCPSNRETLSGTGVGVYKSDMGGYYYHYGDYVDGDRQGNGTEYYSGDSLYPGFSKT